MILSYRARYIIGRDTLLAPSLLPFFRPTVHPQSVSLYLDAYTTSPAGSPLSTPHPLLHVQPPPSPRIMRINTRGSLQGQRRRYSLVDLPRKRTFSLSACPLVYCFRILVKQLFHFLSPLPNSLLCFFSFLFF